MAHVFPNEKNFSVIRATADEFLSAGFGASDNIFETTIDNGIFAGFTQLTIEGGGWLVCDSCNEEIKGKQYGYYVAVLGRILCEECFNDFLSHAVYYDEDAIYENRNFARTADALEDAGVEFDLLDKDNQVLSEGDQVIWYDPEKSAQDLSRVWTVDSIGDEIVRISDEYGEAECLPHELKIINKK